MSAYYNEWEAYPAQWTRNLIDAGHVAQGVVDERSIRDVQPDDIGDGQAHFFAGIGVWSHALRIAGVPDDFPVWTGSCPCQPFSTAGSGKGVDDERHLWPEFARLIRERKPPVVFGEQSASKAGRDWLSVVRADLEGMGYAVGAADLCSASAGSHNIRQRLYWVGYADRSGWEGLRRSVGLNGAEGRQVANGHGGTPSVPMPVDWVECTDGRYRPAEPGTFPLAARTPATVGRLRAYENAINAQIAARFIEASFDAIAERYR